MDKVSICCNVECAERHGCAQFARAMDINAGRLNVGDNYVIIEKCNYEKAR